VWGGGSNRSLATQEVSGERGGQGRVGSSGARVETSGVARVRGEWGEPSGEGREPARHFLILLTTSHHFSLLS
jgi:hypothetical protein